MAKKENRHAELVSASANIEAPYELPEGWKWCRLGDVCEKIKRGKSPKYTDKSKTLVFAQKCNQPDGTMSLEKALFLNEELLSKYKDDDFVKDGDILINSTGTGTIGRVGYFDKKLLPEGMKLVSDTHVTTVRACINNAPKFFYYFIKQKESYLELKGVGTTNMKELHADVLENLLFPLPPTLTEQQRIVNRIETMFAKLDQAQEKAQSVLDSFETRKAAILHKAFTGQLTASWRKENGVPDDSWEEKTLGEICSEIKIGPFGSLLHEDDYIENGIPLVNPKHISNQLINPDTKVSISHEKAEELKSYRLLKNDIVLGRRGEMGRCAPVSENENGWLCGTGSMILRLKPEYQAKIYSILISSHKSVLYFEENAVGTTLKNLNEKIVKNLPMPIISLLEQQEIVRILDTVLEKETCAKEAAQTVLEQIVLLKKSILARAFRGEL